MFTPSTASTSSAQSGLASPKVVENRAAGLFKPDQAAQGKILQGYGKLPLTFEANQGQTDERVKFLSRGAGYNLFLTSGEAVLVLRKTPAQKKEFSTPKAPAPGANQSAVLHMQLLEANPASDVSGLDETPGKSNYFIGDDPKKWRTNVANYTKVRYKSVYPGVDLVYYGNQGQLEYDFVVAPGVDPNKIRLKFRGTGKLRVDEKRDLLLGPGGEVARLKRPVVYQEVAGQRKAVEGSYVLMSANRIGFQLGEYDHTQPLVIDPVLSYSTYLGGSGGDGGLGVAVDQLGNAYVTGGTSSTNFPTVNALQSTFGGASQYAFISKINASGSALVYSTYLGGSGYNPGFGGQGINFGSGIAVDAPGNAYVTGGTTSPNFPTANALQSTAGGGQYDAFVTKINPSGSALVYSTYLGGSNADYANGIAVDSAGNAYVAGYTLSTNFPAVNALQSAPGGSFHGFVAKINPTGSALVYSTYLGGNGVDEGNGIAADAAGNAYVTGSTSSTNFPTKNPLQPSLGGLSGNAFLTKISPSGSALVYSTYLGGSDNDSGQGIAVDSSGNAYVTGYTSSTNFPTTNSFQPAHSGGYLDAFITKINASGSALVYSTYLGGSGGSQHAFGIAADGAGNVYVTGDTSSANFPTMNPLQPAYGGPTFDAFVTEINPSGSALVYSTYLGGSAQDGGTGIAVDSAGNAYLTGVTSSTNFPTMNPLQPRLGGTVGNAFVAKIASSVPATPVPSSWLLVTIGLAAATGFVGLRRRHARSSS